MKVKNLIFCLCIVTMLIGCGNKDKQLVQKCFDNYKSAILKKDGSSSTKFVTLDTLKEYEKYLEWCRHASKKDLNALSFINRFQVLLIKHRVPKEKILALNGKSLFEYAVNNDWIGKDAVIKTEIDNINISSGRAVADVIIGGKNTSSQYHFLFENRQWKYDLVQLLKTSNILMVQMAQKKGLEENKFIFLIAESLSGEKVQESIWQPLL